MWYAIQEISLSLEVGSSVLLPPVHQRLDLLLSILPEDPSAIMSLTSGQVSGVKTSGQVVGVISSGQVVGIMSSGQVVGAMSSGGGQFLFVSRSIDERLIFFHQTTVVTSQLYVAGHDDCFRPYDGCGLCSLML